MNSVMPQHSSPSPRLPPDDFRHALASAHAVIDQAPPPSLREILSAYRSKGDGDRDMLLAMLNAKAAEDQRISSVASLQRTLIDLYQHSSEALASPSVSSSRPYPYSGYPAAAPYPDPSRRVHGGSRSRSPPRASGQASYMPPPRELSMPEHPRKRHRSSRSPHSSHAGIYEPVHPAEQFPPSPYSSSDRSQSAEYSPRSRASGMAIGSLLSDSTAPRRDTNGDATQQERE